MKRFLAVFITTILMSVPGIVLQAQQNPEGDILEINFGDIRSGHFQENMLSGSWVLNNINEGDVPVITVARISGQFVPGVRLVNSEDIELEGLVVQEFADTIELSYPPGLTSSGAPYKIEVSATDAILMAENPLEYSLSVQRYGTRRSNRDEGIDPLPASIDSEPPVLPSGESQTVNGVSFPVSGHPVSFDGSVIQSTTSDLSIDIRSAAGIRSISFLDTGIGLTIGNESILENPDRRFFSDESFTVTFDDLDEYTFNMASGMQIKTTFAQIESISVRDGVAVFRILANGETRRLVFDNDIIRVQSNGNGSYTIQYDDTVATVELGTIDIFASFNDQHRLYVGTDARVVSEIPFSFITGNVSTGVSGIVIPATALPEDRSTPLTLSLDWSRMSDIRIDGEAIYYDKAYTDLDTPDEIDAIEFLDTLVEVLVEDGAVQFTNEIVDNEFTFRRVFPDGTEINTRTTPSSNFADEPWNANTRTRNYNNLGADILPSCPCSSEIQAHTPINPANGNFFYHVTDFSIFTPDLPLTLSRYYNSYDNRFSLAGFATDSRLSPRYFTTSQATYARFGNGWRHSYQYELDITNAPQGRINFIEPDGTGHYFLPSESGTRWTSATLKSVIIFQEGGELGSWRAESTDGLHYYFDRAGRLNRINLYNQSIILTPAPQDYQGDGGMSGTFIVEPYGRRLELYVGTSQRIELVRSMGVDQARYNYDENNSLVTVDYEPDVDSTLANYLYDEVFGLLTSYDDIRSPYTQSGRITYDASSLRVTAYVENPGGNLPRQYIFSYSENDTNYVTSRSLVISDTSRPIQQWVYNEIWQLSEVRLPLDGWNYQFSYDTGGNLSSVRLPTGVSLQLGYDASGNLTRFVAPVVTGPPTYTFSYEPQGENGTRTLLTQRRYPEDGLETFTWEIDETGRPNLVAQDIVVSRGNQVTGRITGYEYDASGRLVRLIEPGNIATDYVYDNMGYLSEIREGIDLNAGDEPARVIGLEYNISGELIRITDPRGVNYFITWDETSGQIDSVTGSDGLSIEYSYSERGLIDSINDRGQLTIYTHNGLDLVTLISRAGSDVQSFVYDPAGNLLSVIDGETTQLTYTYEYDALGNLTSQRSPAGLITRYQTSIDEQGRLVRTQFDPTGRIITRRYNSSGQLLRFRIDDPETFANEDIPEIQGFNFFYRNGNLVSIEETSVGNRAISLSYNLVGDVTALQISRGENLARTTFSYNERGLLETVVSPAGSTTRYVYDATGNIIEVVRPGDITWRYEYDDSGNLFSATDPAGLETFYTYDDRNQLESIFSLVSGGTINYAYDNRGNLSNINDTQRISRDFSYDVLDRLITSSFTLAGVEYETQYAYDAHGRLDTIDQDDATNDIRITYDDAGNIVAISDEEESRTLYSYDGLGRIISITDAPGRTTAYEYNLMGQVTGIRDALGNTRSFTWANGTGFITGYTDISGQSYNINSDYLGRITQVLPQFTEINNRSVPPVLDTRVSYDADGYITDLSAGNGLSYSFEYTSQGNIQRYVDARGGVWTLTYNAAGQLIEFENPGGVITRYTYNAAGLVETVENYANTNSVYTENFEYTANGNVSVYEIPGEIRQEYTYNTANLLAQVTVIDPETETSLATYRYAYNAFGNIVEITEPGGRVLEYTYPVNSPINLEAFTLRGTEAGETEAQEYSIRYDYDDAGNLSNILPPTVGQREDINITYDALNRQVRYVNGTDNSWAYTYDNAGNIIQISDPLGSAVSYTYDQYNRIIDIRYPSNSLVLLRYDANGNLAGLTLPRNDADNSSSAQVIEYNLNNVGWLQRFQIASDYVNFSYDPMGNILSRTAPDGTVTNYSYDAAGRLISQAYGNNDPHYVYSYDVRGNLLSAGDLSFAYDPLERMIEANGSTIPAIAYTYDTVSGNVASRDAGNLGTINYSYDSLYRTAQIEYNGQIVNITYDARGRIQTLERGSVITRMTYDQNNRITGIFHENVNNFENLDQFIYEYDAVGNLIKVVRLQTPDFILREVSYSYDIDQRLISERWLDANAETFYVVTYEYDAVGNRVAENRNGRITTFEYNDQNQLIEEQRDVQSDGQQLFVVPGLMFVVAGAFVLRRRRRWLVVPVIATVMSGIALAQNTARVVVSYEYDVNGNMTFITYQSEEDFELDFDYDNENRLISVQGFKIDFNENNDAIGIPIDTQYSYDAFSRITNVQTLQGSYTLYYDGHTLIGMTATDSTGVETTDRYLNFEGQNLLTFTGEGQMLWNLNDRMGSTRRYADESGTLVDDLSRDYEFSAFGTRIFPLSVDFEAPSVALVNEPVQFFAGELFDPSTGLYLIGLRAYDPSIGRFLQADPVRQDPVGSLYTYARNRPLTYRDPTGMMVEPVTAPLELTTPGSELDPENFIPEIAAPPIPELQQVNRAQEDEFFRLLQLQEALRYGTNDSLVQLSPYLDEVYLLELNPLPEELISLIADPLDMTMGIYESGEGWMPDPRPDPTVANNPFDILSDIAPEIARAYANQSGYNNSSVTSLALPSVDVPQAMSTRGEVEQLLPELLQPIQAGLVFENQIGSLLDSVPPEIAPDIALPVVSLPTALIEPPVMDNLDALREQTYAFYSRIWTIGQPDCDDCVPPLGFGQ